MSDKVDFLSIRVQAIASGSNGNCFLVESETDAVIIDAGISRKRIIDALKKINVPPEKIRGIFITHAHSDHISGLPILKKYVNAPHYATANCISTIHDISSKDSTWVNLAKSANCITEDKINHVGNFKIITIRTQHDSPGTVGYRIHFPVENTAGVTVSVLTDTGSLDKREIWQLSRSDVILLESNYNKTLLKKSNRPYFLKERIKDYHLSNDYTSEILELVKRHNSSARIKGLILGHLSGECNSPDLIRKWVREWQQQNETNWNWYLAPRDKPSDLIKVTPESITEERKFAGQIDF